MNWLAIALVGFAATWFEWNYRRSRKCNRDPKPSHKGNENDKQP
jgi:hypothetical protein